jgi:pimeloyl-ACP methyl ester carboxylesterase
LDAGLKANNLLPMTATSRCNGALLSRTSRTIMPSTFSKQDNADKPDTMPSTPPKIIPIRPARAFSSRQWTTVDETSGALINASTHFCVSVLKFEVPMDYARPDGEKLQLVSRIVFAETRDLPNQPDWDAQIQLDQTLRNKPIVLYLCGGPGADNPPCRVRKMNEWFLRRGYVVLYPEYRGCGDSSPVTHQTLTGRGTDQDKANYIAMFAQDNIVRDLEAIRLCLDERIRGLNAAERMKSLSTNEYYMSKSDGVQRLAPALRWTTLGQSYGGQISLTYISMHPEGLQDMFLTAACPPCGEHIDDVFRVLYKRLIQRNREFYAKYPEDVGVTRDILRMISELGAKTIHMRGRGYLSAQRLLCLGREFGQKDGFEVVHGLLNAIQSDLRSPSHQLSDSTRNDFETVLRVDDRPLFPLMQEQTWASEGATRWSAERVGSEIPGYEALRLDSNGQYLDPATFPLDQDIFFTDHSFCRFHYDTHEGLLELKGVAEILANYEWPCMYDYAKMKENKVPIYATSFTKDMHIDIGLSKKTADRVGNMHFFEDTVNWHQAVRSNPKAILRKLFAMKAEAEAKVEAKAALEAEAAAEAEGEEEVASQHWKTMLSTRG